MVWYGYSEERSHLGGVQRIYRFEASRYGASVVRHMGSYGNEIGLWELAITYNGTLCYTTPITDGVIGYLTEDEVQKYLAQIDALRDPPP